MDVLIKGMEMPQNCYSCVFGHNCPKYEELLWNEIDKERKADCPLVPVPPHGDLIEREMVHELVNWTRFKPPFSRKQVRKFIDDAPTIIEAEVDDG